MPASVDVEEVFAAAPAARAYRRSFPPGRFSAFPITSLDRTGVPVWVTALEDGAAGAASEIVQQGIGYGTTDAEALTGSIGELTEYVHSYRAMAALPRHEGSWRELARVHGPGAALNPLELCLEAGSPAGEDTHLLWCEGKRWPTGETVLVPMDVAAVSHADLPPGYRPFTTPLTNGQGAGPSIDWALAHGLGELIQRDGNGLLFRAMDAGVVIEPDTVADPRIRALLERLRAAGIEVLPKFAADEFGMANVYVVGADRPGAAAPVAIMATACGEAAAPDRERALLKALTEFAAARARKAFTHGPLDAIARIAPPGYVETVRAQHSLEGEEGRALEAMLGWLELDEAALRALLADTVLAARGRKHLSELPVWRPPADREEQHPGELLCAAIASRLQAAGHDIVYLDLATPRAREAGIGVVKAIVPGLEVETMTYHRIGERNAAKLLQRQSPLVGRGAPPRPGCRPVRLTEAAAARLGGPVWLDVEAVDRKVGELYPLYREPEIHSAQLALERRRG